MRNHKFLCVCVPFRELGAAANVFLFSQAICLGKRKYQLIKETHFSTATEIGDKTGESPFSALSLKYTF